MRDPVSSCRDFARRLKALQGIFTAKYAKGPKEKKEPKDCSSLAPFAFLALLAVKSLGTPSLLLKASP